MRTVISSARNNLTKSLSVLIEIYLFPYWYLLLFHFVLLRLYFLEWFLETISANSRTFSILLLHLNSIKIGILAQLRVYFYPWSKFFEFIEIPLILSSMGMSWWDLFGYFKIIIHIESSFSDIFCIFFSLFLRLPFPLLELKIHVYLQSWCMIFGNIPWDVCMIIILIHCCCIDCMIASFRVLHSPIKLLIINDWNSD